MTARILVVEDDENSRDLLRQVLMDAGYEVLTAISGRDGLQMLSRERVDLVLTDLYMPRMDGLEFCEGVRFLGMNSNVPIVFVSASENLEDKMTAFDSGANDFLTKPINEYEVLKKVRMLIELNQTAARSSMRPPARDPNTPSPLTPNPDRTSSGPPQANRHRVLVVEDHDLNRELLDQLLRDDYDLTFAADGEEALQRLNECAIDLVLLDITIPKIDGIEVTRRIRTREEWKSLPVIAVTGLAMKGDRERIMAAGCDDHLVKPLDWEELHRVIRKHAPDRTDGR